METSTSESSLVLPLPRAEYPGPSEAFLSALAWSAVADQRPSVDGVNKTIGLSYASEGGRQAATLTLLETYPREDSMPGWSAALAGAGLRVEDGQIGPAVAYAIRGVRPENGFSVPATPHTKHSSLLQNSEGLMRKAHPFNAASMLERIYALGSPVDDGVSTVASRWLGAMDVRTSNDPLLQAIDTAVAEDRLSFLAGPVSWQAPARQLHNWGAALSGQTPFGWFYRSWRTLTEPGWITALPPRVWVDWLIGVSRMGLGLCYLWEAQWYERLARSCLSGQLRDGTTRDGLVGQIHEVLPWRSRSESTSVRDAASFIRARIARGAEVRDVLMPIIEGLSEDESIAALALIPEDEEVSSQLIAALSVTSSKTLVHEAVRYALSARTATGSQADFYGMLRKLGPRWSVVEPGTEWAALMAALACGAPGRHSTIGEVRHQLGALGLFPDLPELISLLEEAGLARGSADADQAVEVQSPY